MIKPQDLNTTDVIPRVGARGVDIWMLLTACERGDASAVASILRREPGLATVHYHTDSIKIAVRGGHSDIVRLLLDHGASPSMSYDGSGYSGLRMAAERGHRECTTILTAALESRFRFEASRDRWPAIAKALEQGDVARAESLHAESPTSLLTADENGLTPLHVAARDEDESLARWLLLHGADPSALDAAGRSPLHVALFDRANAGLARLLLTGGAAAGIAVHAALGDTQRVIACLRNDPVAANVPETCGAKPLPAAIRAGFREIAMRLLDAGADPDADAMEAAVNANNVDIARQLLERGVDPMARPFAHWAEFRDGEEMFDLICSYGGAISFWDYCSMGRLPVVAAMLAVNPGLATGSEVVLVGGTRSDCILTAASDRNIDVVKLLLRYGASVPSVVGNWPPSYLVRSHEAVRLMLEHGMDPNWQTMMQVRALHYVARAGSVETAMLLLDHGARTDVRDVEGDTTPLGWAARAGKTEMARALVSHGANVILPDAPAWAQPLYLAEQYDHEETAAFLRANGAAA